MVKMTEALKKTIREYFDAPRSPDPHSRYQLLLAGIELMCKVEGVSVKDAMDEVANEWCEKDAKFIRLFDSYTSFRNSLKFSELTAARGWYRKDCPSRGQCAPVAILFKHVFGGELVSAIVHGVSHWFNRLDGYDIDLTGDQFDLPNVQIKVQNTLYPNTRVRSMNEVTDETLARSCLLAIKSGVLQWP